MTATEPLIIYRVTKYSPLGVKLWTRYSSTKTKYHATKGSIDSFYGTMGYRVTCEALTVTAIETTDDYTRPEIDE